MFHVGLFMNRDGQVEAATYHEKSVLRTDSSWWRPRRQPRRATALSSGVTFTTQPFDREGDGGFQGIADDISQSAVSLQPFAGVPKILAAFDSAASVFSNSVV